MLKHSKDIMYMYEVKMCALCGTDDIFRNKTQTLHLPISISLYFSKICVSVYSNSAVKKIIEVHEQCEVTVESSGYLCVKSVKYRNWKTIIKANGV